MTLDPVQLAADLIRCPSITDYGGPVGDEHIDHHAPNVKDILARILDHLGG